MHKLTDRIYYLPSDDTTDRPVLGYVKGDKYSLMVDAGNSQNHANLFLNEISRLNLTYPTYVGITHWHWDHCYGLCALNAISIASKLTNAKLHEMTTWSWTDKAMNARLASGEDIEFCDTNIRAEFPNRCEITVKPVDITFNNTLELDLGNITCIFKRLDNSHAQDSCVIFIPEEKIIFVGDIDGMDFHHGEPHYNKEKLINLIHSLSKLDFEIAVVGHDEPMTKMEYLDELNKELSALE